MDSESGVCKVSGLKASGWGSDEVGRAKASWVEDMAWRCLEPNLLDWKRESSHPMADESAL